MARILLVEDHKALATLRCAILEQRGHETVCAQDGFEACSLLAQEPFDLVITDAELPRGSGREVTAAAKKNHLPVILSTGWPHRATGQTGADFVAIKPCSVADFLALVDRALEMPREKLSGFRG